MKSISLVGRGATATAALVAGLAGAGAIGSTGADALARSAGDVPRTTITLQMPGCDGCDVTLVQGLWDKDAKYGFRSWTSKEKRVADGTVSFIVRTSHTRGMSVNVRAPWEGGQPFVTQVAMRYAGEQVGDRIGFREARSKSKAAPCFAGTAEDTLTIPVTVREVMVQGHTERVAGTIAYSKVTQPWLAPMNPAARGVTGTQDIQLCGERPN